MNASEVVDRIRQEAQRRNPGKDITMGAVERVSPAITVHYGTDTRVKLRNTRTGEERTGTVSVTGGWAPTLMLMHRSDSHGSSDLLDEDDALVAVWDGRQYVEVR